MKSYKTGKNKKGDRIAIASKDGGKTFSVLIEKTNYSLGQLRKSWCQIKGGINLDEATAIFERRTA